MSGKPLLDHGLGRSNGSLAIGRASAARQRVTSPAKPDLELYIQDHKKRVEKKAEETAKIVMVDGHLKRGKEAPKAGWEVIPTPPASPSPSPTQSPTEVLELERRIEDGERPFTIGAAATWAGVVKNNGPPSPTLKGSFGLDDPLA